LKEIYLDANVIIDLIALESLTEVLEIPSALFRATENVLKEIIDPEERELVESVISRDLLQRVALTEVELLRDYAQLKRILGDGEAANSPSPRLLGLRWPQMKRVGYGRKPSSDSGTSVCAEPQNSSPMQLLAVGSVLKTSRNVFTYWRKSPTHLPTEKCTLPES
jgi:hypothetical protein